jgi:hypothetical protein
MENLVYLIVKSLSIVYLLSKVYRFLSGKRIREFWHFLTPDTPAKPGTVSHSIVGKSQTVYLEETQVKVPELLFSENLKKEEPQDEEDNLLEMLLSEEERFISLDVDSDNEIVSTGMTCEQISEALDVVQGRQTDDAGRQAAARILYEVEGSDLFNFLTAQAENEAIVERLIKENLDNRGETIPENIRKKRRETEEFDMDKYM